MLRNKYQEPEYGDEPWIREGDLGAPGILVSTHKSSSSVAVYAKDTAEPYTVFDDYYGGGRIDSKYRTDLNELAIKSLWFKFLLAISSTGLNNMRDSRGAGMKPGTRVAPEWHCLWKIYSCISSFKADRL